MDFRFGTEGEFTADFALHYYQEFLFLDKLL